MSILDAEFMRLAFATGAIVGVLAPAVGFFLVQRRMSLIGDGIGHVAFAGVAAGYLLGISPVATALVASVAGAIAIEWLRDAGTAAGDQALALVFYTGIAAGVVLISAAGALNANLFAFLFGSILTVTRGDLVLVAILGVVGLGADRARSTGRSSRSRSTRKAARVSGVPVALAQRRCSPALAGRHDRGLDADRRHPADRRADGAPCDRGRAGLPGAFARRSLLAIGDRPRLGLRRPDDSPTTPNLAPGGAIVLAAAAAFVLASGAAALRTAFA